MDNNSENPPTFVDPVLREQFEIQMRSQYKWQANNLWMYWVFLAIPAAFAIFGLIGLIHTLMNDLDAFSLIFSAAFMAIGTFVFWSFWGAYKTAKEMAQKLREAEAKGL